MRETREELEMDIELGDLVGVYSRADTRAVLVVFDARALGVGHETAEASEVRAFAPGELPWDEMAFWSTEQALRAALGYAPAPATRERRASASSSPSRS